MSKSAEKVFELLSYPSVFEEVRQEMVRRLDSLIAETHRQVSMIDGTQGAD